MSLTSTTLSAACTASDTLLKITSTSSGFPAVGAYSNPPQVMRVDGEDMLIVTVPVSGQVKVAQRGYNGTVAAFHDILAVVQTTATASDWTDIPSGAVSPRPPYVDDIVTIGEDTTFIAYGSGANVAGTLQLPIKNTTYLITKATAAAITIITASAAQAGVRMTFVNGVAAANTVTYTPGFLGDTTSSDVATASSKVGATFQIEVGYTGLLAPVNTGTGTGWTLG